MNRLKDNRGETLIESLVSLLILTMTFAFLAVASSHGGKAQRQGAGYGCLFSLCGGKHGQCKGRASGLRFA